MMRFASGSRPVISRSIQIRFSLRLTTASLSPQRAFQRSPAEHVEVDVKDDLPALAIHVHRNAVTGQAMLRGEPLRRQQQTTDEGALLRREVVERRDVNLRHDQTVKRRLRMNVLECEHGFVFVQPLSGQLPRNDLAEQAGRVRHGHHCPPSLPAASMARRPVSARASVPASMYSSSPPTGTPYAMRLARKPCLSASAASKCAVASPSTVTLVASTTSANRSAANRCSSNSKPSSAGPMPS